MARGMFGRRIPDRRSVEALSLGRDNDLTAIAAMAQNMPMSGAGRAMMGQRVPMPAQERPQAMEPEAPRSRGFQPASQTIQPTMSRGRPGLFNAIARPLGYTPDTGMTPLQYIFRTEESAKRGRENVQAARDQRALAAQVAEYDQMINGMGLSPQETLRARMAMRQNPEEFGKNLATGFGTNVLSPGSMLSQGFGVAPVMNPKGEETAKPDFQEGLDEQGNPAMFRFDPTSGNFVKVPGMTPMPQSSEGSLTPYQAAQLAFRSEEAQARREDKQAAADLKLQDRQQIAEKTIGQLSEGVGLIDQLTSNPAFKNLYGKFNAARYSIDPANPAAYLTPDNVTDALVLLDQVTGQAFMGGVQQLKGLGTLSDREGQAVQKAMTRLGNRLQTPEAGMLAAQQFKSSLQRLINAAMKEGQLSQAQIEDLLGTGPTLTQSQAQRGGLLRRPGVPGAPLPFSQAPGLGDLSPAERAEYEQLKRDLGDG